MPRDEAGDRAHRTREVETWDLQDQGPPILIIFLTNCWAPLVPLPRPASLALQFIRLGDSKGLEGPGSSCLGDLETPGRPDEEVVLGPRHQEDFCAFAGKKFHELKSSYKGDSL